MTTDKPGEKPPSCFSSRPNLKHEFVEVLDKIQDRALRWHAIPPHLQGVIRRYFEHHSPPGGTLWALFAGDEEEARRTADSTTLDALPAILTWLQLDAPPESWGSAAAVEAWLALRDDLNL